MAREEANRHQHDYVGTEHMLLGLLREHTGVGWAALMRAQLDPDGLLALTEKRMKPGRSTVVMGELPYTSRAKRALELAIDEAAALNHTYVGTEHLLLALVRTDKDIAGQVLGAAGLDHATAVRHVHAVLSPAGEDAGIHAAPPPTTPDAFRVVIDDTSSASIYEQIIAQVQEAVATGLVDPGYRLPPVRRLADELDIAPGTVARAYGELERLGVVVTEGARGTRIADTTRHAMPAEERAETLMGLLRPVVVAAFHLGASAQELMGALERAMSGIMDGAGGADG